MSLLPKTSDAHDGSHAHSTKNDSSTKRTADPSRRGVVHGLGRVHTVLVAVGGAGVASARLGHSLNGLSQDIVDLRNEEFSLILQFHIFTF